MTPDKVKATASFTVDNYSLLARQVFLQFLNCPPLLQNCQSEADRQGFSTPHAIALHALALADAFFVELKLKLEKSAVFPPQKPRKEN